MDLGAARRLARCISTTECRPGLHGLIQHSFALRIDKAHRPFHGPTNDRRVKERFELATAGGGGGFEVKAVSDPVPQGGGRALADHAPLVRGGRTSLNPLRAATLARSPNGFEPLPGVFEWAGTDDPPDPRTDEVRFLFAEALEEPEQASYNDFLVKDVRKPDEEETKALEISRLLLELVAHRRSRLFGLCLANRILNVMLPHAILTRKPTKGCADSTALERQVWFLQPLLSMIRDGQDESELRSTYTLSLLLVPIERCEFKARQISQFEIKEMVNAGWGLASCLPDETIPEFAVDGTLPKYIGRLAPQDVTEELRLQGKHLLGVAGGDRPGLTLRQTTETVAFAVGLRMAQGSTDRAEKRTKRRIANDVVTSLGSARVSSVVVIDPSLTKEDVRKPVKKNDPPGLLPELMDKLSGEPRAPGEWTPIVRRRYRLDRPFVDDDTYVFGVLPHNRCLIVASAGGAQHGARESALMQAGSVAYMTIGAANAIGTMRAIDRDLEKMEDADPSKIAKVEAEIAADVHEIFDLDITRETYRQLYHRLRDRLGIVEDYRTLQEKMGSLYRVTSTVHEERSQRQLAWLTAAIVALSLLILIGTIALAVKPEGGSAGEASTTPNQQLRHPPHDANRGGARPEGAPGLRASARS
jgi:hypothetical protein